MKSIWKRGFSGGLVALALMASPLAAEEPTADTVLVTIDGTEITLGHMLALRAGLPPHYAQLDPQTLFDGILDQLTNQALLANSMEGKLSKRSQLSIENETRAIAASEVIDTMFSGGLSEEEIQAAYQRNYVDTDPEVEYRAAHILVETEDEARDLVKQLSEGADFAALARKFSTGPSGPNGGDLGWFAKGVMVDEFFDAVAALQPGEVSQPVQTQFGWHVIKLHETRSQDQPSLEDVREALESELREERFEAHMEELRSKATIERTDLGAISADVINQVDLLEN